jgi:tubulin-specific chaperone E
MKMIDNTENLLNKRIACNQSIGTIKYVGYLDGDEAIKELYYGIEWDDVKRGKHDGTFKGKKYFTTKYPTSGSFVKPSKVDFGVDIYKAALDKYTCDVDAIKKDVDDDNQDRLIFDNKV